MKSTITFFLLLSSSVLFAQLPGNSPSFTVTQQVGSAEISFTYKASIIEELIENLADDRGIFYPGGKSNVIIRTNKDIIFDEQTKASRFLQLPPKISEIHSIIVLDQG